MPPGATCRDHAATARVAARLQEVSASLNRIAAVDGEDPVA